MTSLRGQRSIAELGHNIKQARLTRRLALADLAERANVSVKTVQRLERGDAGVGIGNLAAVLTALGEPDSLARILRIEDDTVGLSRTLESIPKRGKRHRGPSKVGDARTGENADDDDGVGF